MTASVSGPQGDSGVGRRLLDHVDLWLCALVAVAAIAAVVLDLAPIVRTALGVPLVLLLPGYALTSLLFPTQVLPGIERLLLALGTSIVLAILIGLALAAAGVPLTPASWSVTLGVTTLVGLAFTWLRRVSLGVTGPGLGLATMPRLAALMVAVAALGALNIVAGSQLVASQQESPAPLELWMVPVDQQPTEARLGVRAGGEGGAYVVQLSAGGVLLHEFDIELQPEQAWETLVDFAPQTRAQPIVARLYQAGNDTETRFVVLEPATDSGA